MPQTTNINEILGGLDSDSLAILDIDSTLVYTHFRNQAIIEDFYEEMGEYYPEDMAKIKEMECRPNDYGYYSAIKRLGVSFNNSALEEDLNYYWRRRFFSSDYLHHDQETPGAVDFVRALQQKAVSFVYLTGRYKRPMWDGTISSLTNLGFPLNPDHLILKADTKEKDEDYKSREVAQLIGKYKKVVIIDNEPVIINRIAKDYPEVELIWFESTHSGREQPTDNSKTINTFAP